MKKVVFLISALLIFTSLTANAQRFQGKGSRGLGNMTAIDQLDLNDAQKTKINELRYEHQNKVIDVQSELQKTRLAIRQLNSTADINKDEYLSLVEKRNELRDQLSLMRAELHLDILNQLDDTQKQALRQYKQNNCLTGRGMMKSRNNSGGRGSRNGKNCRFN